MTNQTTPIYRPIPLDAIGDSDSRIVYLTQGMIQKIRKLISKEIAQEFEFAQDDKESAKYWSGSGKKGVAKMFYKERDKALEKANSWTEIQKILKEGGDTAKSHAEFLESFGITLCKRVA